MEKLLIKKYFLKGALNLKVYLEKNSVVLKKTKNIFFIPIGFDNCFSTSSYIFFHKPLKCIRFKFLLKKSFKNISSGFCTILDVIGLGFSVTTSRLDRRILRLNIGYNHSIFYKIPDDIFIKTKRRKIYLFGFSYFLLRNVVTNIKNFRFVSIYKLKGIKEKNKLYVKKN